jgi:hypothetical protein
MTAEFVESLDRLDTSERKKLDSLIGVSMHMLFDTPAEDFGPVDLTSEGEALSEDYLHGSYPTAVDIVTYLSHIEPRWRLDAIEAVDDYVANLENDWKPTGPLGRFRSWVTERLRSRTVRKSSWIARVDGGVVGWMSAGAPADWRDFISVLIHAPTDDDVFSRADEIGLQGSYQMNVFGKPDRRGVRAAMADPEGFVWNHADGGAWMPSSDLQRS